MRGVLSKLLDYAARREIRWLLLIVWMIVIFGFSAVPNSAEETGHVFGTFNLLARKAAHITEYAILYFLAHNAIRAAGWQAFVVCLAYACTDEWHQSFVPGRSASLADVSVDSIGMLIAWAVCHSFKD